MGKHADRKAGRCAPPLLYEVEAFVQAARYQRTAQRHDSRNGFYTRNLGTSAGVIEDLAVPRTRKGFRT